MDKKLTLGSLFDGSGGFPLGAFLTGIEPVWASEIEPFPIRVTTKRMLQVKHYGDICKINGAEIEPVNIITFGSPCQSFSVAGKREGMEGKSGLFYEATRIVREMYNATNGQFPTFAVMENVPGIFSSKTNGKSDFLEVLNEIISIKNETLSVPLPKDGKWSTAGEIVGDGFSLGWRTIDAQFWGVAQRRRRCYLVVDFTGERAGKILFDETRLRGNPPQSGFPRQATAGTSEAGTGGSVCVLNDQGGSFMDISENITGTLRSQEHGHQPIVFEPGALGRLGKKGAVDKSICLRADMGDNQAAVAIPINTQVGLRNHKDGDGTGLGVGEDGDPSYTIQAGHSHAVAIENHPADCRVKLDDSGTVQTLTGRMGTGGGNVPMVMNERQYALTVGEDVANTLTGTDYKGTQCVFEPKTFDVRQSSDGTVNARNHAYETEISRSLDTGQGIPGSNHGGIAVVEPKDDTPKMYGIDSQNSNSMKSSNPHSGIHEMETSRTLDTGACSGNGGQVVVFDGKQVTSKDNRSNPQIGDPCHTLASGSADAAVCVQGSMIGRADKNGPQGDGVNEGVAFTLNTIDKHAVCYQDVVGSLCASDHKFPQQQQITEGKAIVEQVTVENHQHSGYREVEIGGSLKSCGGTNGGGIENMVVENRYVVRRLTPTECALLQGFPPDYCEGLETPEPTEEDIAFWSEVFETHRLIMGTSSKPKSRNQIVAWLKNPHSDAAEYKMWGNGVALPCVIYVLGGIVFYAQDGG